MRCSLSSILDPNYGLIKGDSLYEVVEDHFDNQYDPNNEHELDDVDNEMFSATKFIIFFQLKANNST
jgi:hypothetical protein